MRTEAAELKQAIQTAKTVWADIARTDRKAGEILSKRLASTQAIRAIRARVEGAPASIK